MNYNRVSELRASEEDADDQHTDDQQDGGEGGEGDDTQDQDGVAGTDGAQDDQTDDNASDDADDSQDDQLNTQDQQQSRRAIADRARQTRSDIDPARLASETAAATARSLADANAYAARQAEEERQEREALAGMNDDQRATYLLAKETRNIKTTQAQTQLLLRSNSDQVAFGRVVSRKPQFAKYENEVEQRHQNILAQGGFTTREVILAHLIGERALKAEGVQQQKTQAQKRVQSQRSGTGRGARGDSGGGNKGSQTRSVVSRAERENWAI